MKKIDLSVPSGAIFSEDRKYRYALWRAWIGNHKPLLFIGLNPSTANELKDDPTVTRMMVRASRAGFGGLLAANLYAYVSSNPDVLLDDKEVIGPETDEYLKQMIGMASRVVCGWGSFPAVAKRANPVLGMMAEAYCLGVNRDGQPRHPLYVSYDIAIRRYEKEKAQKYLIMNTEIKCAITKT